MCVAETGIMFALLIFVPKSTIWLVLNSVRTAIQLTVQWAHISREVPEFYLSDTKKKLLSKLHFWKIVNIHILEHGALLPVKRFKHGTQLFYSKTKEGVDGETQARALLRASTTHMKLEQKIVCHIWKTLLINAFIASRIAEKSDLLQNTFFSRRSTSLGITSTTFGLKATLSGTLQASS
jgi:hypothetical protein